MNAERRLTRRDIIRVGISLASGLAAASPAWRGSIPVRANPELQPVFAQNGPPPTTQITIPGLHADGPLPGLRVSTGTVYQGGAVRVLVPGAATATASLFGRSYRFEPTAEGAVGYIGIGTMDSPGETSLAVDAIDPKIGPVTLQRTLRILETDWTVDYILLPPGAGGGGDDPDYPRRVREEIELLATTYARVSPRRWEEPWRGPIDAPVSGYFGEQRSFNGGPVSGHHGGTDFGADAGAPVRTCNAGTVVVARQLATRGNAVAVDHGSGIVSLYGHLSAMHVAEGDAVAAGQVIGLVGSTGLSTGPHLHWELGIRGILVDGLRWLDGSQGF